MTALANTSSSTPTAPAAAHRPLATRHLTRVHDLAQHEVHGLLALAARIKRDPTPWSSAFHGMALALAFEKPSLRTRASFEVGFQLMGGSVVFMDQCDSPIGQREALCDWARSMERWFDAIVVRTMSHDTVAALTTWSSIPVVNALSDLHHPCQAMADLLTLAERSGSPSCWHVAWVGDGNNVCHSLMEAIASVGGRLTVITPAGLAPSAEIVRAVQARCMRTGASIKVTHDLDAVAGVNAIYTDTWISMGQVDAESKRAALRPYQVNAALMAKAAPGAIFMHCLPAHRGEEVTDDVIDAPTSVVFDQAENRMHVQCAILLALLRPDLVELPATLVPGDFTA
ncbi:MAG: ornithine carbamoyltransferase [Planctomycetes bacterium]|nr:ornithine carbamoyltransferase [Planctomycetota bacterium]